ncbi:MAG: YggS family pyridoxal phosphate-dependent enzyme [Candidatus Handelsmanbacteria bacterium]|nr:YggS family pyridoxal phosphate-dependent enzyme [Candidatus Handelsmanbacteria bacterium]
MDAIRANWQALQERISRAALAAGRDPAGIEVVAVTKTRTPQEVEAALGCGLRTFGENRVQEAAAKKVQVRLPARWHLIGHLQGNKAGKAVELFDLVESVDSLRLGAELDRRAGLVGHPLEILIQVNTSGAPQQSGAAPEQLPELAAQLASLPHLRLRGLMTIGALSPDEAAVRSCFARLRRLRDQLAGQLPQADWSLLSMGMSGDFEWAIAEGANLLRLGTALFGARPA